MINKEEALKYAKSRGVTVGKRTRYAGLAKIKIKGPLGVITIKAIAVGHPTGWRWMVPALVPKTLIPETFAVTYSVGTAIKKAVDRVCDDNTRTSL